MTNATYWGLFLKIRRKYPEWSDAQVGIVVHKILQKDFKAKIINYIENGCPKDIDGDWVGGYVCAFDVIKNMVRSEREV